jgi:hypothetical protein
MSASEQKATIAEMLTNAHRDVDERRFQRRVNALESVGLEPPWSQF